MVKQGSSSAIRTEFSAIIFSRARIAYKVRIDFMKG